MLLPCIVACDLFGKDKKEEIEVVDYVANTKLDMASESLKIEVTVKTFIDGDTTHFYLDDTTAFPEGFAKVRYLAIDTPESTGKIEEWGKSAASFTKEKLRGASAIMLESDTGIWNFDNNGRLLAWVWYKADENSEWRNLNLEILQSGYAVGSNSGQNRYGDTCLSALSQATKQKLYVHSGEQDPSYPYGVATPVSIKELRANPEQYEKVKVALTGLITQDTNGTLYIQQYDEEDETYYGMSVFYGYNMAITAKQFLKAGNFIYLVGIFQYADAVKAYQIGGLEYDAMKPGDPAYTHLIEAKQPITYPEIADVSVITDGERNIVSPDGDFSLTVKGDYTKLHTTVSIKGLKVISTYTTNNEESSNNGAISLTCEKDGKQITIRTIVLRENNQVVTADRFEGKTIDVEGIIDSYTPEGSNVAQIQVKVFTVGAITIH